MAVAIGAEAQSPLVGFATYRDLNLDGTTGGADGKVVHATTRSQFANYAKGTTPYVIIIDNDLEGTGINDVTDYVTVGSNKTIVGAGAGVTLNGLGLNLSGASNVIIRNITITKGKPDGIAFRTCHHIWVDHCDLSDCDDGLLDFTIGSSYMTVSWTRFTNHDKVSICNSGTQHYEDDGKERVTYHHCSFENTTQRNPRVGYGLGHVFNTYYYNNSSYCIGYHTQAKVVAENNYFNSTKTPLQQMYSADPMTASYADCLSTGNIFNNCTGNTVGTKKAFDISRYYEYDFALNEAADVPGLNSLVGPQEGIQYDIIPFPGNGAIGVLTGTELLCGAVEDEAEYYYVIGTSPDAMTDYDPDKYTLLAGTKYYWQVTAVCESGTYTSQVFQFTTAPDTPTFPIPYDNDMAAKLREHYSETKPCQPMTLQWREAFNAKSYNVYLATDSDFSNIVFSGNTTSAELNPGALQYGTQYYWRVDAVAKNGTVTTGDVWTFASEISYSDLGRTEMEHMVLNGRAFLEVQDGTYFKASNDTVTVGEAGPGSMSTIWKGDDMTVDITTAYYDENDGQGWYGLYVGETCLDTWNATDDNEKIMTHTTEGVTLTAGDEIRIEFYTNSKMMSRTDYIDIAQNTTGIRELTTDQNAPLRIYSLSGTYLGNNPGALTRGIYIINGKKFVIK